MSNVQIIELLRLDYERACQEKLKPMISRIESNEPLSAGRFSIVRVPGARSGSFRSLNSLLIQETHLQAPYRWNKIKQFYNLEALGFEYRLPKGKLPPSRLDSINISGDDAAALESRLLNLQAREKRLESKLEQYGAMVGKDENGLYSEQELVRRGSIYQHYMGIYFLISSRKIVYVGKSVNIWPRIASHYKDRSYPKKFDCFAVVECKEEELDDLETHYITKFVPRYNGMGAVRKHLPENYRAPE